MRYEKLTDEALLAYLNERYARDLGVVDLRISGERRFTGEDAKRKVVFNVNIVGPNNASDYKYWLAQSKPAWGRTLAEKPAGWTHYIVMVGVQPDGVSIWWSIVYDEQAIRASGLEPEWVRSGYGRLRPDEVRSFIAAGPHDELQMTMFDDEPCRHSSVEEDSQRLAWRCVRCGVQFVPAV